MDKKLKYSLVLLIFLIGHIRSQNYPVQVTTNLSLPYSGYLKDYANEGSEQLKIILQCNDLTVPSLKVKLRFVIKGAGFLLSTKTFYTPPPILLQPAEPVLFTGGDLAPYLSSYNLDFTGFNQNQYEQSMSLPEGYYSICVVAYDYDTNKQISNESCVQAWFTQSDPPLLNQPVCNAGISPQVVQSIIFQWTPMNLGSPNSSMNTEYDFELWECKPDSNANPNQVVLSTNPIFSASIQQNFFNYGITEPVLNLYTKYIWRVRARDLSGRDLFKNNGYSQVCTFTYGSVTNVLGNVLSLQLTATTINHRTGQCQWNAQSAFSTYLLQVRKQGTQEWFDYTCSYASEKISNLEAQTTYECRVRGEGSGIFGEWSNIATFTTSHPPSYSCNDQFSPYNIAPSAPLPLIKGVKGLVIQSGQFEIKVTEINSSGTSGWYSGKGVVALMGIKKVPVRWTNIFIDSESRHQQGVIEAITEGIDKWLSNWDNFTACENATYVNGTIDSVFISGNQVCYALQGNSGSVCSNLPTNANVMVIRDGEGNQYSIQTNPLPPKITGKSNYINYSTDTLSADSNQIVFFEESPSQTGGFDKKQFAAFIDNYEIIKLKSGKNYFVPNKSIHENETDEVLASISISSLNPSLFSFKAGDGTIISYSTEGGGTFKLSGITHSVNCIYAIYNGKPIGKLNVLPLKKITRKLRIVPVNGTALNLNEAQLNSIYKQAGVTWSITSAPNFTFDLGTNGLDSADADLLTKYSGEMRRLRNAYIQHDSLYDKQASYLFVVPAFSDPTITGYMVRGRALGFLSSSATIKTVAHELAHGAFGLEHTFPDIERNTSNNLLDYGNGIQLVRKQWLQIQTGKFSPGWFDEEEDAKMHFTKNTAVGVFFWINKIKIAYKKNVPVTIPYKDELIGRAYKCYLGGIQYDSICVYVKYHYTEVNVNVKNNITISNPMIGSSSYSAVCVGGDEIVIRVPAARLLAMKTFLEYDNFKNLLLFVNGYRPIVNVNGDNVIVKDVEYSSSDNTVEFGDSRNYWCGIDAQFMNRIGTRNAVYADGHFSVRTSNHGSVPVYLEGNSISDFTRETCKDNPMNPLCVNCFPGSFLHTTPNKSGFDYRKNNGAVAAADLLHCISTDYVLFNKETDSLDIVAHSMGYAYAVGMIDVLRKANIKMGRFYIIAPENACSGGTNWTCFKEVWQYGSDLGQPNPDPPWDQDGVAPQCAVSGLPQIPKSMKGGRVFIPKNFTPKGFLASHSIINYGWIFTINNSYNGYVKQR